MVFSSLTFLFAFLPVALLGWYLLPKKLRTGFLLLVSLVFYAWGEPLYVFLMIGSILANWGIGIAMSHSDHRKKLWLILSIVLNLALIGVFKYAGLLWDTVRGLFPFPLSEKTLSIRLPIGISFFTFQIMSYVIDVYRGNAAVQKNPVVFGAYVSMFPQLIAGPIVRYVDIESQLLSPDISIDGISDGIGQFVIGLSKKVLLANTVGMLWTQFSADPLKNGVLGAWIGLFAYTLQIYFDFSGYSDMACGLGCMLGFRFVQNFNYPYIAGSVSDFWRRWHISLSTWFREYVYIPRGGNRCGKGRQALNLLIVWGLTGLWHGASWNFLIWGLYFGLLLIAEKLFFGKLLDRLPRVFRHLYTMLAVMIGWCIFSFTDFGDMTAYLGSLFGVNNPGLFRVESAAWALGYLPTLLVAVLAALPFGKTAADRLRDRRWFPAVRIGTLLVLFLLCLAALASQSYNPFIYFRF